MQTIHTQKNIIKTSPAMEKTSCFSLNDWNYEEPTPDKSDLGYETIGLDVRTNPLFWESLNARILEINKEEGKEYPYFDTEKEIRLATELKAKKSQK